MFVEYINYTVDYARLTFVDINERFKGMILSGVAAIKFSISELDFGLIIWLTFELQQVFHI